MSPTVQGSISNVFSATEAQNRAKARKEKAKKRVEAANGRLEAELNVLLKRIRVDHNGKGLRRVKDLRVWSIKMTGQKIAISVEAILAGKPLFATEEPQIFKRLRDELCPRIKSALKGLDPRVKVDMHLRIYYRGAMGYLGNFEEGRDY